MKNLSKQIQIKSTFCLTTRRNYLFKLNIHTFEFIRSERCGRPRKVSFLFSSWTFNILEFAVSQWDFAFLSRFQLKKDILSGGNKMFHRAKPILKKEKKFLFRSEDDSTDACWVYFSYRFIEKRNNKQAVSKDRRKRNRRKVSSVVSNASKILFSYFHLRRSQKIPNAHHRLVFLSSCMFFTFFQQTKLSLWSSKRWRVKIKRERNCKSLFPPL